MKAFVALPAMATEAAGSLQAVELSDPICRPDDLLIRVQAVAVNPVDLKVQASLRPGDSPRVLGWDGSGVVEALGAAVQRFRPGDEVVFAGDIGRPGCRAERVAVDARICGRKPAALSFAASAALPLTGLTAWESLFDRLGVDPEGADTGRSLLILGAAGGVGSMMVQLARHAGLTVIATASRPESQRWVRQLGASHVVDHHEPIAPQLRALGFDGVDLIANLHDTDRYWMTMAEVIRPQGAIVAIVGNRAPLDLNLLKSKSIRFCWEFMFTRPQYATPDLGEQGAILDRLADLIEAGRIRTTLRETPGPITVENLTAAQDRLRLNRTIGKIVLAGWE
jgi:zinc-binding alcohol dehydrogenase family protein